MDLGPLRALALEINFSTHAVPVSVTIPEGWSVATSGIWLTPVTEELPSTAPFQRSNAKRIMSLRRDVIPNVPLGTRIVGPEKSGDADKLWRVDGTVKIEADQHLVSVVLESSEV